MFDMAQSLNCSPKIAREQYLGITYLTPDLKSVNELDTRNLANLTPVFLV
jgi:hypothetical protein